MQSGAPEKLQGRELGNIQHGLLGHSGAGLEGWPWSHREAGLWERARSHRQHGRGRQQALKWLQAVAWDCRQCWQLESTQGGLADG